MTDTTSLADFDAADSNDSDSSGDSQSHDDTVEAVHSHTPSSTGSGDENGSAGDSQSHDDTAVEEKSEDPFIWQSLDDDEDPETDTSESVAPSETTDGTANSSDSGSTDTTTNQEPVASGVDQPSTERLPSLPVTLPETVTFTPSASVDVTEESLTALLERTNQLLAALLDNDFDGPASLSTSDVVPKRLQSQTESLLAETTGEESPRLDDIDTALAAATVFRGLLTLTETQSPPSSPTITSDGLVRGPLALDPIYALLRLKELLTETLERLTLEQAPASGVERFEPTPSAVPDGHADTTGDSPHHLSGTWELPSIEMQHVAGAVALHTLIHEASPDRPAPYLAPVVEQLFASPEDDCLGVFD